MLKNVGIAVIRNSYFILESALQVTQAQIEGRSNGKKEKVLWKVKTALTKSRIHQKEISIT